VLCKRRPQTTGWDREAGNDVLIRIEELVIEGIAETDAKRKASTPEGRSSWTGIVDLRVMKLMSSIMSESITAQDFVQYQ
jgi:hypothetical protein